ncbi:hypothetical protein [Staphylococcus aureus]|uniref:hypothetical protein n=1 Tax=Staphylococcus aureus TaxID=1280 RepID=UPI0020C1694B|nr:hypothetical protein [Staphylococcus aureus]
MIGQPQDGKTPWFENAKKANGGQITDTMIHQHIGELEKMIDYIDTMHKIFGADETQQLTLMIYKQCLEVHKEQLKRG